MYFDTFMKEKPRTGLDIMANRGKRSRQMDEELADFFRERAQIEESYSKQLAKLSKKQMMTEKGLFSKLDSLWDIIQLETGNLSVAHGQLAQVLLKTVERPVREATNIHSESSHLRLIESNAQRLLKEYEDKTSKIAKLQKTAEKNKAKRNDSSGQKMIELSKSLEEVRVSLESEMKRFYEQNEWVDISRLETIKKALIMYNSLQAEAMSNNSQSIEMSLNSIQQFVTSEQITEFCSVYKDLNLSSSSLSTSTKLAGKIETGGFGSWILRPRKNSGYNTSQASVGSDPNIREPRTGSIVSFGSFENGLQSQVAVDEEGFSVPPAENMHSEPERDSDEFSDSSSFAPQQKVKFDIKEEAIKDKPEDVALAFSNVTSTLRVLPKQKNARGRRERGGSDLERSLSTVPEKNSALDSTSAFPSATGLGLQAWSVERVDAIVTPDGNCKAQISGELRVIFHHHDSHVEALESFISHLQGDQIQVFPNPQFISDPSPRYSLLLDNLESVKEHEVVLLMYRIQTIAPSSQHPLLPLKVDAAFDADPSAIRFGLTFAAKDSCKPMQVTPLKLGTSISQVGKVHSKPPPVWNPESNELTWEVDLDHLGPVICQLDGVASAILSLSFDFLLEDSIANFNWASMAIKHTAKSGTFLLTSQAIPTPGEVLL